MLWQAPKSSHLIRFAAFALALNACTVAQSETAQPTETPAATSTDVARLFKNGLTVSEFASAVQERNVSIQTAMKDIVASQARLMQEDAVFDLKSFAKFDVQNSIEQLSRDDRSIYQTQSYSTERQTGEMGVSALLRNGGDIRFSVRFNRELLGDATDYEFDGFAGFTFTKPLMRGAGEEFALASYRAAEIDESISKLALKDRKSAIGAQASLLFMDGLLAQNDLNLFQQRIDILVDLMARSDSLISEGRLPKSAKFEIENAIDQLRAQKSQRQLEFDRFRSDLMTLMGVSVRSTGTFSFAEVGLPKRPVSACHIDKCVRDALRNRMDLAAQRLREDKQHIAVGKAKSLARPKMDFMMELGVSSRGSSLSSAFDPGEMSGNPTAKFGVEIEMPLRGNRMGEGLKLEAQAELESEQLRTADMRLQIENEIYARLNAIDATAEQHKTAALIAARSAKNAKMQKDSFEQGRADIMEVLQAHERLLDTEARAFEARINHLKAVVMLRASQGKMDALKPGVSIF